MAIESRYLRQKIKYHAAALRKYMVLTDFPDEKADQYFSAVEIHVIEIAALTRKLRDLGTKLPDNTLESKIINLVRYKSHGPDSQRAYVNIEKEYDLDDPLPDSLPLSRIVDLIIHSYVLQAIGENELVFTHVWVTSDYSRLSGLYQIRLKDFLDACVDVSNTWPTSLHSEYDQKAQKWIHVVK